MMNIKAAFAQAYDLLFSGIMHCSAFDPEFIRNCYCGPMLSLIISFREDEINYRMMLKNAFLFNSDLSSRVCFLITNTFWQNYPFNLKFFKGF